MKLGYNPKDVEGAKDEMFWILSEYSVRNLKNKGFFFLSLLHRF